MKKTFLILMAVCVSAAAFAQTNPAITGWLRNTTGITGRHYVSGNSTPIVDATLANVQQVRYSTSWVYVNTNGIPAYITGPFLDGNTSLATSQNGIFKFPLTPARNTGTPTATTGGNIGLFINGVALFDYRDGVAWNNATGALCGGPGNPTCPGGPGTTMAWTRDAIPAERRGFDCAKAHPAMGNYHHHQNPSAFNLDRVVLSTICSTYPADGLYVMDSTVHSPLLGFAYDGFPIYGAFGYANTNGTGAITHIKSSYALPSGVTTRANGPAINQVVGTQTMFHGYFREDYVYTAHPNDPSYLDEHNGRFCVTPEYPNGTYAYFCTVDANWNSAYPYVVGPTFYGTKVAQKVTSVTETTTTYSPTVSGIDLNEENFKLTVYPNPAQDFIAIQTQMTTSDLQAKLVDALGQVVATKNIAQGSTLCIFETETLYNGTYYISITDGNTQKSVPVVILR